MTRKVKAYLITFERDEKSGRVVEKAELDKSVVFEFKGLPLEEAKAKARELLERRGFRVRGISVAHGTNDLVAYVSDQPPIDAPRVPGWVHKFPQRRPRP